MSTLSSSTNPETVKQLETGEFGVTTSFAGQHRLSEATRRLAARYLAGEIGRQMRKADFTVAPAFVASGPTDAALAAEAIRTIAERAPLRIMPGEKLVGAATLLEGLAHMIPLTEFRSISHTTLGFEQALAIGYRGIRQKLCAAAARDGLDAEATDLYAAMEKCLDAATLWHGRYVAELERLIADAGDDEQRRNYVDVLDSLRRVPECPPRTFREAIQALWLLWDFQRLGGNWSGIGRIDKLLGPYLRRDLDAGRITLDEARELVAHFWIKGCEWIGAGHWASGDAQFYQNIVLAGIDEKGEPVLNEVTDLVLDVVEELHISDFPIAVRLNATTPERLLRRIAAIQRLGGGIIAVYNEDRIIDNMVRFGYPLTEARNFANDGCWEVLVPGKTAFGYQPFDALLLLQETLGLSRSQTSSQCIKIECDEGGLKNAGQGQAVDYPDFEALYADFRRRLAETVDALKDVAPFSDVPCPLLSLLVDGCIERGRSYLNGGPVYTVRSPHAGGLPDVGNSLLVIKRLVYERGEFTLDRFVEILRSDWADSEPLRRRIARDFDFYGNDSEAADAMVRRVYDDYVDIVGAERERHGVLRPAGISTFARNGDAYLAHRTAAASGHKTGTVLATNFSPTPGTDRRGPTAVIRSHCSMDYSRLPCGTALELKILPDNVRGETGLAALSGLMRSFVQLGGIFMQIDVVDSDLLLDAQAHPEKYPNLSVRVSGWSARFATLTKQWQDIIIGRTQQVQDR